MSGLAAICLHNGDHVSGSDRILNHEVQKLIDMGATFFLNHDSNNIHPDLDIVVYTAAVREDNPELLRARELDLHIMDRAHFLGYLMRSFPNGVAISGTHGKTSTTSMISSIFLEASSDPTISVGGNLPAINGNYRLGSGNVFITEACEYVDSFLALHPKYAIILNIEHEHIDYFKTLEQEKQSFRQFALQVPSDGIVIANGDDLHVRDALTELNNILYVGFDSANDCFIQNYVSKGLGSTFSLKYQGQTLGTFELNVIGRFNASNAAAAIMCAFKAGVSIDCIRKGIASYRGVGRRFEKKGTFRGALVIDDYAHHPTEVKATLQAAKDIDKNRLITVFQPHTFSRTLAFMNEFQEAFDDTDVLILADIYPSREIDTGEVHSKDLYDKLSSRLSNVHYIGKTDSIYQFLAENVATGDVIIAMGAGDINRLSERLIQSDSPDTGTL